MWSLRKAPATAPDPGEVLRTAIRERVDRAVAGNVEASGAGADEVQRLTQLLAAYEQTRPPQPRRAWPIVALVLAVALVISALLLLRMPTTEVTLALDLSSLSFRVGSDSGSGSAEPVELLDRILTDQVMIDDLASVELDDIPVRQPKASDFKLSANGEDFSIHPRQPEASEFKLSTNGENFSIHPLEVPAGTWVRVNLPDEAGRLTIELAHPTETLEVRLNFAPGLEVLVSDPDLTERFAHGVQKAVFRAERPAEADECARLRLQWRVPSTASGLGSAEDGADASLFKSTMPVDALLFIDLTGGSQHLSTRFSSVLGGRMYLEAVGGREVAIRRDQLLDVGLGTLAGYDPVQASGGPGFCADDAVARVPAAPARIMRIAVGADAIALQAVATVDRLSTGTATHRQNLMPRRLEWLQTRPELLAFWGAFVSLFGLAYTVLLWWRGNR
jgi:hypothetical protein